MNAAAGIIQPSAWLINRWAMAEIVSAASRFIPVPYAEEAVRYRCRRFVVTRAAIIDSLKSVRGLKSAAVAMAARVSRKEDPNPQTLDPGDKVQSGAAKVQSVLDRPETLALFAEFDRRFDDSMLNR